MQTQQGSSKHFILFTEVMKIGFRKMTTRMTLAYRIKRSVICFVFGIFEFYRTHTSKGSSMSSKSCRHHTIKHINTTQDSFTQIIRSTYSHKISGHRCGQMRFYSIQHRVHFFSRFSYTGSTYCDPIRSKRRKCSS